MRTRGIFVGDSIDVPLTAAAETPEGPAAMRGRPLG
jgi:hypothetical protein